MELERHVIVLVSSTEGSIRFRVKYVVNFNSITVDLFTLRIIRLNSLQVFILKLLVSLVFLDNHIVVLFTFLQCMI